jgi:hypothetical protein
MPRMTITLSAERQRALKEAAARRGSTITAIIDQSLELAGIRTRESSAEIVARARANSRLNEQEAMDLALRETTAVRKVGAARQTSASRQARRW